MAITALSGRSWLILAVMPLVITIVAMNPQAVEKNPKLQPTSRSTVSATRKIGMPTAQATYRARQGKVAFGGPSQTASTR
jgi:hypothetical protein